jgi:hypothetical protein
MSSGFSKKIKKIVFPISFGERSKSDIFDPTPLIQTQFHFIESTGRRHFQRHKNERRQKK